MRVGGRTNINNNKFISTVDERNCSSLARSRPRSVNLVPRSLFREVKGDKRSGDEINDVPGLVTWVYDSPERLLTVEGHQDYCPFGAFDACSCRYQNRTTID